MGKGLGVLSVIVGALFAAFSGCGKSDDSGGAATLPQWPARGLTVGDSVSGRVTQSTAARTSSYSTFTEIVDRQPDGSSYRVDKYRVQPAGRVLESSQWQSAAVLFELQFESRDDLAAKCAGLGGRMLALTLASGRTMETCRVVSRWMNGGVSGAGETYLGPVPFGIVRRQWTSTDRTQKFQFEVTSYRANGRTESL